MCCHLEDDPARHDDPVRATQWPDPGRQRGGEQGEGEHARSDRAEVPQELQQSICIVQLFKFIMVYPIHLEECPCQRDVLLVRVGVAETAVIHHQGPGQAHLY